MSLIFFYGHECPHCEAMRPLLMKLAFETGITCEERDVWSSEADYRTLENYQQAIQREDPLCEGLPFFYDTVHKTYLCGAVSYKKLKAWALGPSSQ